MLQKGFGASRNLPRVASENSIQPYIHRHFQILHLTDGNSRAKQERNTKLGTHSEMDPQY